MPVTENITIVTGYHPNTPVPDRAVAANMNHRFAVVFHTDREDVDYMYFDAMLFCDVIEKMSFQLAADELKIEFDDGASIASVEGLRLRYQRIEEEVREPPLRIEFFKSGRLHCVEETEFWVTCGGPHPYSDSYTASFFTETDRSRDFIRACQDAVGGIEVPTVAASENPMKSSWWRRKFQ